MVSISGGQMVDPTDESCTHIVVDAISGDNHQVYKVRKTDGESVPFDFRTLSNLARVYIVYKEVIICCYQHAGITRHNHGHN